MSGPRTGFEETGAWTTLADETALLTQVADETALVLTEVGRTVEDRPIWRCDLGAGSTTMIVCLQHGTEPASREAGLQLVRDLAYSSDPDVISYLETHRVVVMPTVNADRVATARNNANNVNLNRDWFRLTQPETHAVQEAILDAAPAVLLDAHETLATTADWRPYPAGMPGTHHGIADLGADWVSRASTVLAQDGYSSLWYSVGFLPWPSLSTTAGGAHTIGLLSETVATHAPAKRVEIQRVIFQDLLDWHRDHTANIDAARTASREAAVLSTEPVPIPTREYIGTGAVTTVDVAGYTLDEPIPQHLVDAHGITVSGSYVTVDQPARLVVAALCDPDSSEKVVAATRVPRAAPVDPRVPLPDGVPVSASVMVGGRRRPVIQIVHRLGGRTQAVSLG